MLESTSRFFVSLPNKLSLGINTLKTEYKILLLPIPYYSSLPEIFVKKVIPGFNRFRGSHELKFVRLIKVCKQTLISKKASDLLVSQLHTLLRFHLRPIYLLLLKGSLDISS